MLLTGGLPQTPVHTQPRILIHLRYILWPLFGIQGRKHSHPDVVQPALCRRLNKGFREALILRNSRPSPRKKQLVR